MKINVLKFFKVTSISVLVSTIITGCSQTVNNVLLSLANRPQTPKERPYVIKEVNFSGGEKDVNLACELTMPSSSGNFPAVVMVTGSGEQDRNEEFAKHKPFLVISDYLTKNGYAVLRCDDRGVGKSTGNFDNATTEDFSKDAVAAMKWLKKQKNINSGKIGFLGHSEGGIKAPLATLKEEVNFLILLAAPVIPHERTTIEQQIDFAKAEGKTETQVKRIEQVMKKIVGVAKSDLPHKEIRNRMVSIVNDNKKILPSWMPYFFKSISINWFQWLLRHDTLSALKSFDQPILALYGGKDTQVSSVTNSPIMQTVFNHEKSKIITYPTLNHFFQPAKKGTIEEIPYIDITFDESVLKDIIKWLKLI